MSYFIIGFILGFLVGANATLRAYEYADRRGWINR